MPLRLLVREDRRAGPAAGTGDCWSPTPSPPQSAKDSDARKILGPDGRIHSRWSDGLDEAVATPRPPLARAESHGVFFRDGRRDVWTSSAPSNGRPAVSIGVPVAEDFLTALQGAEGGRQCRYNPRLPLDLQVEGPASDDQQINYGIQRALVGGFAREMTTGESALEGAEASLLFERGPACGASGPIRRFAEAADRRSGARHCQPSARGAHGA